MSAFSSLILLTIIAGCALCLVAFSNYKVEQTKLIKLKLQQLRVKAEEMEDMVLALDRVCETRMIGKLVNEEIIELYEKMIEIDSKARYLQAGLTNAKLRSEELSNELSQRELSRICNSDAQIARLHTYLEEAIKIIRNQHTSGKISTSELQDFTLELTWNQLQVHVISNIVQGHKAYSKQDISTANAYYKKAQKELLKSGHSDPRRQKMISQVSDIIYGRRNALDESLMPESEFNPEAAEASLNSSQSEALEKLISEVEPSLIPQITAAFIEQQNRT